MKIINLLMINRFRQIILVNEVFFYPRITRMLQIIINSLIITNLFATISVISGYLNQRIFLSANDAN